MNFPHPFVPDMSTRAGRMMAAGRCKVTLTRDGTDDHITVLFQAVADNRDRTYDPQQNKNWVDCEMADATHLFAEVPTPSGGWNDKIGTYYPKSRDGRWYDADHADPTRVRAAFLAAWWIQKAESKTVWGFTFQEAIECGVCGLELSDPVSVARGIGPTCYGRLTGSHHQEKWKGPEIPKDDLDVTDQKITFRKTFKDPTERNPDGSVKVEHAHRYHVPEEPQETIEDLGLPSAAENAAYGLLKGMSEEQLRTLAEWVEMRTDQVVKMRKALIAEVREQLDPDNDPIGYNIGEAQDALMDERLSDEDREEARDQSFMGR